MDLLLISSNGYIRSVMGEQLPGTISNAGKAVQGRRAGIWGRTHLYRGRGLECGCAAHWYSGGGLEYGYRTH